MLDGWTAEKPEIAPAPDSSADFADLEFVNVGPADDYPDIPEHCRRCFHCNGNDAVNEVAMPDRTVWLHRECEEPWLATHHNPVSPQSPIGDAT